MFQRILILCTGNICRSPVAAAMLEDRLTGKQIESAGLNAPEGQGIEPTARLLAEAEGLDVSAHQARQVSLETLFKADLVLVMSDGQRLAVGQMAPSVLGKTMLFGRWLDGGQGREIPDPYRKSDEAFRQVHQLLHEAADSWVGKL
ncbi:low molecular weight phosphotyrosine protein phosphatase [Billgrantia diversa]|uniref:low molecular weight protein-tyrosine-phosphatase n=1 Tax=Halomonas sp. MCCC 1A13316 TaxID=2733487 RepID=UPI0018A6715E|nr:low molecular weight protein-tyrosine-phosphatase [Halomonas sp. MCCC 1A13316]QOR39282.1 low molecular weight phosphotyrosine protein phosphatase [Halomonas sp. MCCC 1A13316]